MTQTSSAPVAPRSKTTHKCNPKIRTAIKVGLYAGNDTSGDNPLFS
jgi:hypothetical protein